MATILVIDDDPVVRTFLRYVLERHGHTVWEAPDGVEGLRMFQAEPPELVLCDLYMPKREGMETMQELRALDPAVKLIALSGDPRLLPAAQALGADATLSKPMSRDALLVCVEGLLARAAVLE